MKQECHTCDHCGKKLDTMIDLTDLRIELCEGDYVETDLCKTCYDGLVYCIKEYTKHLDDLPF